MTPVDNTDLPLISIRRLRLSADELASQLGAPTELIRMYQRNKFTHDLKRGEIKADLGFMSEELSAFIVIAYCHHRHGMPISGTDRIAYTAVQKLCTTFAPDSVFLVMRGEKGQTQGALLTGEKIFLDDRGPYGKAPTVVFDLTALRHYCDAALEDRRLKLPRAQECVLSPDDPRINRRSLC